MRSDMIKKGLERTPHRALIKGTGVPENQMDKPFIGVATSFYRSHSRSCGDAGPGAVYRERDSLRRRLCLFLRNSRSLRRHCHGAQGHALFPPHPGTDCRHGGIGGRSAPARRSGASDQLRQDYSRHADGRSSAGYSLHRGYRRADDVRAGARRDASIPLSPTPSKRWRGTRRASSTTRS